MSGKSYIVPKEDGVMLVYGLITALHDVHANNIDSIENYMNSVWSQFVRGSMKAACGAVRRALKPSAQKSSPLNRPRSVPSIVDTAVVAFAALLPRGTCATMFLRLASIV